MAKFVKVGTWRINLDKVTHVQEFPESGEAHVYLAAPEMNSVEITGQAYIELASDEARQFLAIIDQDEPEPDYPEPDEPEEPEHYAVTPHEFDQEAFDDGAEPNLEPPDFFFSGDESTDE